MSLWFEDETEENLEDRPSFAIRCLKYGTQLSMLLVTIILLIDAKDETYNEICNHRLLCHNECSDMYFPSVSCDEED